MKTALTGLLGSAVLYASTSNLYAAEEHNAIVVTANRFAMQENETPFAAEIYNASDIQNSGADNLYDFLDQYTSLTVLPSFGNPFVQKLDMRGYGIGDGYQNMVITLNGQRLNNIDMVPQLLSAISPGIVERIEITKGSGSVISGDGAMAGTIHLYTKDKSGVTFGAAAGSHGQSSGKLNAGVIGDTYSLSFNADKSRHDGYSVADVTGKKDKADSENYGIQGKYFASSQMELRLGHTQSTIDITYPGNMTQAEFYTNPAQNSGNTYTQQRFTDDNTSAGMTYDFSASLKLDYDTHHETKTSEYISPFSFKADYVYDSHDLAIKHDAGNRKIIAGLQVFDGEREGSTNNTSKVNTAYFVQGLLKYNSTNYSIGARSEQVEYTYQPNSGAALSDSHSLTAYEIGVNLKYSDSLSVFTNYQHAYQAPDIDRFFNFGGTFNAFIEPAISDTLNVGINRKLDKTDWKIALFYVELENEIYYNSATFTNTNIDRSHKYGLEFQTRHNVTQDFSTNLNYTYTRAIIDSENDGGGTFNGKHLPGVSAHTLNLGLTYKLAGQSSINLGHVYRSEAYAANDFANDLAQKQPAYNSTNVHYRYRLSSTTLYAGVENLFDNPNGIQVRDDAIYPVNFTRAWKIGFTTKL